MNINFNTRPLLDMVNKLADESITAGDKLIAYVVENCDDDTLINLLTDYVETNMKLHQSIQILAEGLTSNQKKFIDKMEG